MFWYLTYLAILGIVIVSVVITWINHARIGKLIWKVQSLERTVKRLNHIIEQAGIDISTLAPKKTSRPAAKTPAKKTTKKVVAESAEIAKTETPIPEIPTDEILDSADHVKKDKDRFEKQFGARLPVWIGGVALALAGFFLVKYTIDNALLSPVVRVTLGGVLGLVLLGTGYLIRSKPDFPNGVRIAQSVSGAGIAVLYVSLFAATSLYHILPPLFGLAGMGVTTAVAVILSVRHGPPIAWLGLIGGFLTPALLGANNLSTPLMFVYLLLVFSGLMTIIRKQDWWVLSLPSLFGAFLWVIYWLFNHPLHGDALWIGLFLIGISAAVVIGTRDRDTTSIGNSITTISALNYAGLGGALALMGLLASSAGFGILEWGLFGLLALGSVGLAYFDNDRYGFVPWASMAVNLIMLIAWDTHDYILYSKTLGIFAAIYMIGGYVFLWKSRLPLMWAGLIAATSVGYYLLAYFELHETYIFYQITLRWSVLALILAGLHLHLTQQIWQRFAEHPHREILLAIFASLTTAFVSLALTIELEREFLSVAFAAEALALAWISSRLPIKALRPLVAVLAAVFAFVLVPQVFLLIQLTAYSLVEAKLYLQETLPIVDWPLFQLGVPAAMFIGASYYLRKERPGTLTDILEMAAIALVGVMGYYLIRHAFHVDENVLFVKASYFERGVITNILFIYGITCFWTSKLFHRNAFAIGGIVLSTIVMFRIGYFDLLTYNPLFRSQAIGETTLFNAMLLPFGIPLIWSWLASLELERIGKPQLAGVTQGFMLVMLFALISLNVRHYFHGENLTTGIVTNAEIYSYSVAWLLMGIGLLAGGIMKQNKMLRYASLGMILLSVGKVFLYDAGELEGLYRVFSFFGLGLCLLGISYFYTRFVFDEDEGDNLRKQLKIPG